MTNGSKPEQTLRRSPITGAQVAEYLRRHPDFLVRNPELLTVLTPPSRQSGDSVVDMQHFMVERQRRELDKLRAQHQELIEVSRGNLSVQTRIHAAVLQLLAARSFEHLIDIVTHELSHTLGADAVTLCVEGEGNTVPRSVRGGVFVLRPGQIDALMGENVDICLSADGRKRPEAVFGPAAGLIRSDAMLRLKVSRAAPQCLLAVGARDPDYLHPQQGTELLGFLARAVEHGIRVWLDLPNAG